MNPKVEMNKQAKLNGVIWLHFAVRPPNQQNRRKINFLKA